MARLSGVFVIIGALAVGIIGWIALSILAENIRQHPETQSQMPALAVSLINARTWLPFVAALMVGSGAVLIVFPRSRGVTWLLFLASMLGIATLFVVVLYCFLSFVAPLYEYQPL